MLETVLPYHLSAATLPPTLSGRFRMNESHQQGFQPVRSVSFIGALASKTTSVTIGVEGKECLQDVVFMECELIDNT